MATSAALSVASQKSLLDAITDQKKQAAQKARIHGRWTAGLVIASAILFIVCPPVGILAAAGPVAAGCALVGGAMLAGDALINKNLNQATDDAGKEGLLDKLAKKTERLRKLARIADATSTAAAFTILGTLVAGLIFPPVAAVTAVVFNAAIWPLALGSLVNSAASEARNAASVTSYAAIAAACDPTLDAKASAASSVPASSSAPALTTAPTIKADFTGANTGTAPAEKAPANDAAPAPKKNLAP